MKCKYSIQCAIRRFCLVFLACLQIVVVISAVEEVPQEAAFGSVVEALPSAVAPAAPATAPSVVQKQMSRLQATLVKKLLQKWGYMVTEQLDGHWEMMDWRQESLRDDGTAKSSNNKNEKEENENSWSSTEKNKYSDGLRSFQMKFNLPVTGDLDPRTVQLMKQPRCAVPDSMRDEVIPDMDADLSASPSTSKRKSDDSRKDKSGKKSSPIGTWQSKMDLIHGNKRKMKKTELTSSSSSSKGDILEKVLPTPEATGNVKNTTPVLSTLERIKQTLPNRTLEATEVITDGETDYSAQDTVVTESPNVSDGVTDMPSSDLVSQLSLEEQSHRHDRRRRNLPGIMNNILQRSKRSRSACNYGFTTSKAITWRILKKNPSDSNYAPLSDSLAFSRTTLRSTISEAFRRWAEVSMLTFRQQNSGSSSSVDIWIQFVSDGSSTTPYGCNYYTGCFLNSEQALSFQSSSRSYMYFRDDPNHPWSQYSVSSSTWDLLTVAVHEIGHILCLDHDYNSNSVMYPVYSPPTSSSGFQVAIDNTARNDVKNLYGACNSPFVAFDWVRTDNGVKRYSTYIFRGDHYWLWGNSNKQTRYSDPRDMSGSSSEWPGVPSNLQAIVQILPKSSDVNMLYFFAGGRSYLYDQNSKRVIQEGAISSIWKRKYGSNTDIPSDIKAAYYDKRDGNVYFFTSSLVYVYDRSSSNQGCCNSITSISSAFPGLYNGYPSLENNIHLAYYSIYDGKLYFFKGGDYWQSTFNPRYSTSNAVYPKQANWHQKWNYICEVE